MPLVVLVGVARRGSVLVAWFGWPILARGSYMDCRVEPQRPARTPERMIDETKGVASMRDARWSPPNTEALQTWGELEDGVAPDASEGDGKL